MTSIAVAAMVCLQGESLTHHINQMKLLNAIATAAVALKINGMAIKGVPAVLAAMMLALND